jgi:hypothetical protein
VTLYASYATPIALTGLAYVNLFQLLPHMSSVHSFFEVNDYIYFVTFSCTLEMIHEHLFTLCCIYLLNELHTSLKMP